MDRVTPLAVTVSGSFTASLGVDYTAIATLTVTDPTPVEGKGFTVLLLNGTATIGGVAFSIVGTLIRRYYHSGAWLTKVNPPLDGANTWTAAQTFRAANAIRSEAASTQDAMILAGRAGGSSSYASTLTTAALTASRTITFPDATGTAALLSLAQTFSAAQAFSAGITVSGGNINLTRSDAAQTTLTLFGLTGQLQVFEIGVSNTERWAWYRDNAAGQLHLFENSTGIGGGTGNRLTMFKGGDIVIAANTGLGGYTPVTGNGLLQLASGTTKANGIAAGIDTFLFREGAGQWLAQTDQVAATRIGVKNATSTDGAYAAISAANDSGMTMQMFACSSSNSAYGANFGVFGTITAHTVALLSNNAVRATIDSAGNVVLAASALATNATDRFTYLPSCAGTPTGTPTTKTGMIPVVIDSTNHKLYFYSGGSWRDAGP